MLLEKEGVPFEVSGLRLVAQAADGSMRDGLSLLDQLIAFGGGKAGEDEARAMLGTISRDHVERLAELLASLNVPELMKCASSLEEFAPDYAQVLDELAGLLVRVAMKQTVSDFEGDDLYAPELLERLAKALAPEDIQLFYQTAITGRRDLGLAPDPRTGFEMTLLRMIAFRPANDAGVAQGQGSGAGSAAARGGAAAAAQAAAVVVRMGPRVGRTPVALPVATVVVIWRFGWWQCCAQRVPGGSPAVQRRTVRRAVGQTAAVPGAGVDAERCSSGAGAAGRRGGQWREVARRHGVQLLGLQRWLPRAVELLRTGSGSSRGAPAASGSAGGQREAGSTGTGAGAGIGGQRRRSQPATDAAPGSGSQRSGAVSGGVAQRTASASGYGRSARGRWRNQGSSGGRASDADAEAEWLSLQSGASRCSTSEEPTLTGGAGGRHLSRRRAPQTVAQPTARTRRQCVQPAAQGRQAVPRPAARPRPMVPRHRAAPPAIPTPLTPPGPRS